MMETLVAFLYLLARDELPLGKIEELIKDIPQEETINYSNKHLEAYARSVADRILNPSMKHQQKIV